MVSGLRGLTEAARGTAGISALQAVLFHASRRTARQAGSAIIGACGGLADNRARALAIRLDNVDNQEMPPAATLLDPAALQRLHDLDPSGASRLVERVFSAFEDSVARMRPQLVAAYAGGDKTALRHVAHTLKSSSASLGAIKLSRLCAEIESMARQDQLDGMSDRIHELCVEIDAVLAALKLPLTDDRPA